MPYQFLHQIGAIYIWSYVYIMMRVSISKSIEPDDGGKNVEASLGVTSGSTTRSSTEPLLCSVVCEPDSAGAHMPHQESLKKVDYH